MHRSLFGHAPKHIRALGIRIGWVIHPLHWVENKKELRKGQRKCSGQRDGVSRSDPSPIVPLWLVNQHTHSHRNSQIDSPAAFKDGFVFSLIGETFVFAKKTQLHLRTNFFCRLVGGNLLAHRALSTCWTRSVIAQQMSNNRTANLFGGSAESRPPIAINRRRLLPRRP